MLYKCLFVGIWGAEGNLNFFFAFLITVLAKGKKFFGCQVFQMFSQTHFCCTIISKHRVCTKRRSAMITTILFDLDNTLFDFNKAERLALSKTLTEIGIPPTEAVIARYSELNLAQWRKLELGELTREQVKVRRYELLFRELGTDYPAENATAIYESFLAVGHFFMEGAEELLKKLAESNSYRLYLVTNGTKKVQEGRLFSAGISHYFTDIFISEEIGYDKPRIEYFEKCFARIPDFQKEKTVIVGDSLTSDIKGGINAGIRTVWFNPSRSENETGLIPDFEIHSLKELPAVLTGFCKN